jgi:hypothetical protein
MEVKGQLHPRPFLPRRKSGHYPMNRTPTQTPEPMTFWGIQRSLARAGIQTTTPISQISWPSHNTKNKQVDFFFVSLTAYLSITLANDQLFNTFITILYMYMFRAISCSSSGGQIVLMQHLVSCRGHGLYMTHHTHGDSLYTQFNHTRRILSEFYYYLFTLINNAAN